MVLRLFGSYNPATTLAGDPQGGTALLRGSRQQRCVPAAFCWRATCLPGAAIQLLRGWRFTAADSITGTTSWKVNTRVTPSLNPPGPVQENGIVVKISAPTAPVTFNITTTQGNFSFSSQDVPFGVSKTFLNGRVLVAQTGARFQLTSLIED